MPTYQTFEVNWTSGYDFTQAEDLYVRISSDNWSGYYNVVFGYGSSPIDFIASNFLPVLRAALGENEISLASGPNIYSDKFDFLVVYEGTLSETNLSNVVFSIESFFANKRDHNLQIDTITEGEDPRQTVQTVSMGNATEGNFTVTTDEGPFTVYIESDEYSSWINPITIQNDINFSLGVEKYIVTQPGGTTSVTIRGYNNGYQNPFYISANSTNGTPTTSVVDHGSDGTYEQQNFYFDPDIPNYTLNPTDWDLIGHAIGYSAGAAEVENLIDYYTGIDVSVSGDGSQGDPFAVTWNVIGPRSTLSPIGGGSNYWYVVNMAMTDSYFEGSGTPPQTALFMASAT